MKLGSIATGAAALLLAALPQANAALTELEVALDFPAENAFGHVYNGGGTVMHALIANPSKEEAATVTSIYGSYYELGGRERALRNTTALPLKLPVGPSSKTPTIPYTLTCENKPGQVGLRLWVDWLDGAGTRHVQLAYDSTVTVVEPPVSFLDIQLLSVYALLAIAVAGAVYFFAFPLLGLGPRAAGKGGKSKRSTAVAPKYTADEPESPAPKAAADSSDWIPEHHLRSRGKRTPGGATSGEDSGAESPSGGPRRSARKARK